MKLSISQIRIPHNYVLVKPDEEFEKFQHNGKDSLFVGVANVENVASHYSIRGKVYAVPEKLNFFLSEMQANKIAAPMGLNFDQVAFYFRSQFVENNNYRQGSVLFDTDMEVSVGDTVFFNYQEHYQCYDDRRFIHTKEHGEMLFMRYDSLICSHPVEAPETLKMLNGYALIEPISVKDVFGSDVYSRSGLFIANTQDEIMNTKKKKNIGYVRYAGKHCRAFMDSPELIDPEFDFKDGDLVLYNPKKAPSLEFNLHKSHFGGKQLVKIHRRDIFCVLSEDFKQELPNIVSDIHLNK